MKKTKLIFVIPETKVGKAYRILEDFLGVTDITHGSMSPSGNDDIEKHGYLEVDEDGSPDVPLKKKRKYPFKPNPEVYKKMLDLFDKRGLTQTTRVKEVQSLIGNVVYSYIKYARDEGLIKKLETGVYQKVNSQKKENYND